VEKAVSSIDVSVSVGEGTVAEGYNTWYIRVRFIFVVTPSSQGLRDPTVAPQGSYDGLNNNP
jgi:hypothetical protein